ncbi:MAG: hypothetical protein Q9160_006677 [Pyrenula sp. 1 TL-2023]
MGSIFSLSYRLIAWLGPEKNGSDHALSVLQYIGEQVEISNDHRRYASEDATEDAWDLSKTVLPYDDNDEAAVAALLSRPYFERVWVMQECAVANHEAVIRCGHDEMSFHQFSRAVITLCDNENIPVTHKILTFNARDLTHTITQHLIITLLGGQCRKCEDQRDKIYGILSLAPRAFAEKITVNYTLTAAQVYTDFMLRHLNHTSRFDLLPYCSANESRARVPSWVPDWSKVRKSAVSDLYNFQAAGLSTAVFHHGTFNILNVVGVECATINSVSEPIHDRDGAINVLKGYEPVDLLTASYVNGESSIDSWLRMMLLDLCRERFPEHSSFQRISNLRESSLEQSIGREFQLRPEMLPQDLVAHISTGSLITTNEKHFGFSPSMAKPGDLICVILGCFMPMILRPKNPPEFTVVGRCYIQGLMDGEAVLGSIPSPWTVRQYSDDGFSFTTRFFNKSKDTESEKDPRLGPVPPDWEMVDRERTPDDPFHFSCFRNKQTGGVINWDPRMEPKELEKRGVKLQTFRLGGDDDEFDGDDGNDENEDDEGGESEKMTKTMVSRRNTM